MTEFKRGVENLPLRQVNNHCPIFVYVRNLQVPDDQDDVVAEYKMDLSNPDDRKHLGRLTFWAVTNHHSIETLALSDAEGK